MYIYNYLSKEYEEVSPMAFYRDIFPLGELEDAGEYVNGKYTGIVIEPTKEKRMVSLPDGTKKQKNVVKRYSVTDDLDTLDELICNSQNFCIMSPISYAGKSRKSEFARNMYALVVELDGVLIGDNGFNQGMHNLFAAMDTVDQEGRGIYPRPTYVVASGTGVHLYYVFERPVPMFDNVVKSMVNYKNQLTKAIWNKHNTWLWRDKDIQYESIFQPFRVVGTNTKEGIEKAARGLTLDYEDKCRAYRTGEKVTIEYLNLYARPENTIVTIYKSDLTLSQAKEQYPEWHQKRIVEKKPKGHWTFNRAVYDKWKERIAAEATGGHRYYCMMILAINAKKCSEKTDKNPNPVTEEELETDCLELLKVFDEIEYKRADGKIDPFTEEDMWSAIQAFYDDGVYTYPTNSIINRSGLHLEKSKRNGRKQKTHLKLARASRDILCEERGKADWREGNGRPSAEQTVEKWRRKHPDGKKADCIRGTGLDKKTVYKWWEAAAPTPEKNLWERAMAYAKTYPPFQELQKKGSRTMTAAEKEAYEKMVAGAEQMSIDEVLKQ